MKQEKLDKKHAKAALAGKKVHGHLPFSIGPRFLPYLVTLAGMFVFSQQVPIAMSAALFVVTAVFPIVCLLYVLICRFAVKAEIEVSHSAPRRKEPFSYVIRLRNRFFLPVVHLDADLAFPSPDGATVLHLRVTSTIPPFGAAELSDNVVLPFHGRLSLAVKRFYVYDFFRLFRVRKVLRYNQHSIEILPRQIAFHTELGVPNQEYAGQMEQSKNGFDRSEQSDIRAYHEGDPIKDIHWKLSARTEELIVKEYDRTSGQRFFVVSDYSNYFHPPADAVEPVYADTVGHAAASAVAEVSQAVALAALKLGFHCYSVFRTTEDGRREEYDLTGEETHHALFRRLSFQTSDVTPTDVTALALGTQDIQNSAVCFVVSHVTEESVKQIQRFAALQSGQFGGRTLVYYADCSGEILIPEYKVRFVRYQMKLLQHLSHTMQVCCVRELPDGVMQYFDPSEVIPETH